MRIFRSCSAISLSNIWWYMWRCSDIIIDITIYEFKDKMHWNVVWYVRRFLCFFLEYYIGLKVTVWELHKHKNFKWSNEITKQKLWLHLKPATKTIEYRTERDEILLFRPLALWATGGRGALSPPPTQKPTWRLVKSFCIRLLHTYSLDFSSQVLYNLIVFLTRERRTTTKEKKWTISIQK